jgi:thioredoxin reductase
MNTDIDVVVVGGGPAGLSAATWLARHRRSVVLVDSSEQRNRWVDASHGYLGSDPVAPAELLARARRDLGAYPDVRVEEGRVRKAVRNGDGDFRVDLEDGPTLHSKRVILATGVIDEFPDLPGFFDHYGTSVFHCPSCDGYEAKERAVVVFGWSPDIPGFAAGLLDWAASVTVVTDGRTFEGDDEQRLALARLGVSMLTDEVVELRGGQDGLLEAVRLRDGGVVACQLGFFSLEHHPRTELAEQLGCELDADGHVVVDGQMQTTVAGVYAAGDVAPGVQLVQAAAGQGAVAGSCCGLSLRDAALEAPAPDSESRRG